MASTNVLTAASSAAAKPGDVDAKTGLDDAALAVNEALNELSELFQSAGPGQAECNAAMKAIKSSAESLAAGMIVGTLPTKHLY